VVAPRTLVLAGVVLVGVALLASGHVPWWLVGVIWFVGPRGRRGCGVRRYSHLDRGDAAHPSRMPSSQWPSPPPHEVPTDRVPADRVPPEPAQPDPTRDHHRAFPD
jgi:hypothetical protein